MFYHPSLASEYSDTNKAQDILHTGYTDYISHYKYNKVYSLTCLNVTDTNFCPNVLNLNIDRKSQELSSTSADWLPCDKCLRMCWVNMRNIYQYSLLALNWHWN